MMSNELAERLKQAAAHPSQSITVAQLKSETRRRRQRQACAGAVVALVAVAGATVVDAKLPHSAAR